MKNNIRQMIKNVVEENAVSFKDQTAKVLYGKVGQRLQEQYKTVAKTIMTKKEQQ
jgi:predicted oxidoreductase (fatty acid repression mutant protein)